MTILTEVPANIKRGDSFHELYPALLEYVLEEGALVAPRGESTLEISPFMFILENPEDSIRLQKCRRINYAYAIIEKLSLVYGVADPTTFCFYIKSLENLVEDGDFGGAYGPRVTDQIPFIYNLLREDPDSRRAVITIYSGHQDHREILDIPCTIGLQFLLRNDRLDLIAYMRSSDVYLGLPYDIQQFTFLQRLLANWLNIELGTYTHIAGSGHIYKRDVALSNKVIQDRTNLNRHSEPLLDLDYDVTKEHVSTFFNIERMLRERTIDRPDMAPDYGSLGYYLRCCLDKTSRYIQRKAENQSQLELDFVTQG
jgi:thymidylate synthase